MLTHIAIITQYCDVKHAFDFRVLEWEKQIRQDALYYRWRDKRLFKQKEIMILFFVVPI